MTSYYVLAFRFYVDISLSLPFPVKEQIRVFRKSKPKV